MIFDAVIQPVVSNQPSVVELKEPEVKSETHQITDCLTRQIHDYNTQVDYVTDETVVPVQTNEPTQQNNQNSQNQPNNNSTNIPNTSFTYTNLVQSHSGQPMMSTGHEPVKTEQEIQALGNFLFFSDF